MTVNQNKNPLGGTWTGNYVIYTPSQIFTYEWVDALDGAVPVEEKKPNKDGCSCIKCEEFYPFGEPNQSDGTLICWSCRNRY